ncbi:FAD:protein FMN transferase [Candidatus Kaiserbacteria bacterium]|nr:FAD:protein FMN transferase [Candidatus Kaiserbacteria bacterium]
MKDTRLIMGMPVVVEIVGSDRDILEKVFEYFTAIDERFSTYKETSEISRINRGELSPSEYSDDMRAVLKLAEDTKHATHGYFDIRTPQGTIDPSGVVKGWAINGAAQLLHEQGYHDFWVEAGGDIQTSGHNAADAPWSVGIRNPFDAREIVKVLYPAGRGIATSGDYIRGKHIYDPHTMQPAASDITSLTVIGPDVDEADRIATAAFAMGIDGILFVESLEGFEAYAIDRDGTATLTSGLAACTQEPR